VANARRNPSRTATTANALLIGVFLVTLVTAAGTSVKDFAVDEIRKLDSADYFVSSQGGSIDDRRAHASAHGSATRCSSVEMSASVVIPSASASKVSRMRWRRTSCAMACTSSGAT